MRVWYFISDKMDGLAVNIKKKLNLYLEKNQKLHLIFLNSAKRRNN